MAVYANGAPTCRMKGDGVDWCSDVDLEVEVGVAGVSGGSDQADDLADGHLLADGHIGVDKLMVVPGCDPAGVADVHVPAVSLDLG
jgi:hypothetical protein